MRAPLRDVVVVLPGIMGSALRDARSRDVWNLTPGSVVRGVLTGARSIKRLQLPVGLGDEHPGDGVVATALVADLHVIPGIWSVNVGYDALLRWFHDRFEVVGADPDEADRAVNLVRFPYDWRLSNRYNARLLGRTVEPVLERFRAEPGNDDARLVLVGHSMGGLVARYYVDVLGGHEITKKVITLGTPHRGALNALESLVNGIRKGFGPVGLDLTELARSLPSLHQLLPEYACIESGTGLAKTTETTVPELRDDMVADAMRFHDELAAGAAAHGDSYDAHPILARTQPTATTARLVGGRVESLRTYEGSDQKGDGTVPRVSAAPYGMRPSDPRIRYVMEKHGALPSNAAVLVELEGVLTATETLARAPDVDLGVALDDVALAGEPLAATIESEPDLLLAASVRPADGGAPALLTVTDHGDGRSPAPGAALPPGGYEVTVGVSGAAAGEQVTAPLVVVDPAAATDPG